MALRLRAGKLLQIRSWGVLAFGAAAGVLEPDQLREAGPGGDAT